MTARYTVIDADTGAVLATSNSFEVAVNKANGLHRPDRPVAVHDAQDIRGAGEGGHLVYETADGGRWL